MAMPGEIHAIPASAAIGSAMDTNRYHDLVLLSGGTHAHTAIFRENSCIDETLDIVASTATDTDQPPSVLSIGSSYGLEALTVALLTGSDDGRLDYTGVDISPRIVHDATMAEYVLYGASSDQNADALRTFGIDVTDGAFSVRSLFTETHNVRFVEADASSQDQMEPIDSADIVLCHNVLFHLLQRPDRGEAILNPMVTNMVDRVAMGGILSFGRYNSRGVPKWLNMMTRKFASAGLQPVQFMPKEQGGAPFAFQRLEG